MDSINISLKDKNNAPPENAVLVELKNQVILPFSLAPVVLEANNLVASEKAVESNRLIATFSEMPSEEEMASVLDDNKNIDTFGYDQKVFSKVGTLCRIIKKLNFPDGSVRILVRGICRIEMVKLTGEDGVTTAYYNRIEEFVDNEEDLEALKSSTIQLFQEFSMMSHNVGEEFRIAVLNINSYSRIADVMVDGLQISYAERLLLLNTISIDERFYRISAMLNRNIMIMQVGAKIQNDVHTAMNAHQKEFFLQEQIKIIKKELGEDNRNPDIIDLDKRMQEANLPENVLAVVKKELARLEVIPQMSPEYHVAYNYADTILSMPWNKFTDDRLDVAEAKTILDEDHYGLNDVKERILEFLSVLKLNKNRKSPILCLVGPPGVGKTSLGQSIARALNRKFVRIALGGVRDEAEIRGHRRTYIGAMPGRIIQSLKKCESSNPLFMLDEIDKLASDMRGDPASALLEVLDSSQNSHFSDHYLDVEFDLSKIFFIATANSLDSIPAPLLDRMEIIRLAGYTSFEKREIAKQYLIPRALEDSGLNNFSVKFNTTAINELIDYYTREAGVRQLERVVSQTCRKIARKFVDKDYEESEKISLKTSSINELLGARKYTIDLADKKGSVGSATGMAWTSVGGVILTVESIMVPGKGALKLTGSLGKVMQESAEAAFTYIKYRAKDFGIDVDLFANNDFHIHVPDGATPKDGPSAGITMATVLYSLLTKKTPKAYLSMTGEINLRGRITIIGGVKEKVLAALRAGVKEVILPEENRKDLEDIPEEIQAKLKFHFVSNFDEAIKIIF